MARSQGAGGMIEITIPSSSPTSEFANELRTRLESMGYTPGQAGDSEDDEDDFP